VNDAILDAAAPPATSPNGGAGHEFWKRLQQHRPSPSQSVDIQQQHLIDAAMNMSTQVTARVITNKKKPHYLNLFDCFHDLLQIMILSLSSLKKTQLIFSSEQNAIARGREITNLVPQVVEHFCHILLS